MLATGHELGHGLQVASKRGGVRAGDWEAADMESEEGSAVEGQGREGA